MNEFSCGDKGTIKQKCLLPQSSLLFETKFTTPQERVSCVPKTISGHPESLAKKSAEIREAKRMSVN
jgi:hypothetical protein